MKIVTNIRDAPDFQFRR